MNLEGASFSMRMNSGAEVAWVLSLTSSTSGVVTSKVIGEKSSIGSYVTLAGARVGVTANAVCIPRSRV